MAASQGPRGDAWSGVPRRGDSLGRSVSGAFGGQSVKEEEEEEEEGGRKRPGSSMGKVKEDEDEDRIDARNAASRLATSTF